MAKTKQVAKIEANGKKFTVVFRDVSKGYQFVVYEHTSSGSKHVWSYANHLFSILRALAFEFE